MKKKICIFTGTRAEYGLLKSLMNLVGQDPDLTLQVLATGSHLSPDHGLTIEEIRADGFKVDETVEILLSSDTSVGICKAMGLGLIGFSEALARLNPHCTIILGDRFEAFAMAAACMIAGGPVAHLHGGESTLGLIDEPIRHSITKMSHLHFTSTEVYRNRVIQMGELPERVFNVGAPGVETILKTELLTRESLEDRLGFSLGPRSVMITFHPVTLEKGAAREQMNHLLSALDRFRDLTLIFTKANADEQGRLINQMVGDYVAERDNAHLFSSLGQTVYLSTVAQVNAVVGNSSSGIIEAPSLGTPTVNIGNRQGGRIKAESVRDCPPMAGAIAQAMDTVLSAEFQTMSAGVKNPYEKAGTARAIISVLKKTDLSSLGVKPFYDLNGADSTGGQDSTGV